MPMHLALTVRLRGEMLPAKLTSVQALLRLTPAGRLDDDDDSSFGHRYLREDENDLVVLDLYRRRDAEWHVRLTYQNEPPSAEIVEHCRAEILTAATQVGLTAESVWVNPIFTRGTSPGRT